MTKTELPNSKESEMMVIGCMLTSVNGLNSAAESLDDQDFYYTEHKTIFSVLKSAYRNDKPADVHLVAEELKRQDKLKAVGGVAHITTLAQYAGTSAHIEEYINVLKELSGRRRLLNLGVDLQKKALSEKDPKKIILDTQENLKLIEKNQGFKDKFRIKFLNEFDEDFLFTAPEPKEMLLDYVKSDGKTIAGFLPKKIVAMLVGAGGVGKTHLLSQLAISIATGTPFLDTLTPTKHCGQGNRGNVFFGLGENQYDDIHRLLYKASKKLRKHQPDLTKEDPLREASKRIVPFSFCGHQASFIEKGNPSMYFRELKNSLQDKAPLGGWALIILDPVSRLIGADAETDNAAATQFISLLEELTIELPGNPTVLFAHHTNKASIQQGASQNQSAARGSSAFTDGVRWQCNFAKDIDSHNKVILKMTKSNFTPIFEDILTEKSLDGFIEKCKTSLNTSETVNFG